MCKTIDKMIFDRLVNDRRSGIIVVNTKEMNCIDMDDDTNRNALLLADYTHFAKCPRIYIPNLLYNHLYRLNNVFLL